MIEALSPWSLNLHCSPAALFLVCDNCLLSEFMGEDWALRKHKQLDILSIIHSVSLELFLFQPLTAFAI